MRWTTRLRLFLRSLFLASRVERDLDDELRFHIQTVTERYVAQGLTKLQTTTLKGPTSRRDLLLMKITKQFSEDIRSLSIGSQAFSLLK